MKSAKCPSCGFVGWADAEACKRCGEPMTPKSFGAPGEQSPANHDAVMMSAPVHALAESSPVHQAPAQPDEHQTYYYAPGTNPFPEEVKTGWAITSLVSGILNVCLLGVTVVTTIVGIVLSVVALKKINREPYAHGGKGMAVAGLAMNIVSLVMLIPVLIIMAIAIPNLMAARRAANEGSAINSLRRIHSAQMTYQATRGRGKFGSLMDLQNENLLVSDLASGTRHGYRFTVSTTTNIDNLPSFSVVAVPTGYPSTGRRSFFLDETGVIRGGDMQGSEASKYDEPLNFDRDYPTRSASRNSRQTSSDDY